MAWKLFRAMHAQNLTLKMRQAHWPLGGSMKDVMDQLAKNQPKGDKGAATAGTGPQDPKVVAEQLRISLEGIKESADYLLKSDFVK